MAASPKSIRTRVDYSPRANDARPPATKAMRPTMRVQIDHPDRRLRLCGWAGRLDKLSRLIGSGSNSAHVSNCRGFAVEDAEHLDLHGVLHKPAAATVTDHPQRTGRDRLSLVRVHVRLLRL
jgi:hypothetical protein